MGNTNSNYKLNMKKIIFTISLIIYSCGAYAQSCAGISGSSVPRSYGYKTCVDSVIGRSVLNTVKADTVEVTKLTVTNLTDGILKSVSDVISPAIAGTDYPSVNNTTLTGTTTVDTIVSGPSRSTTTAKANGEQFYAQSGETVYGKGLTVIETQSGGVGTDFTHSSPVVAIKFTTTATASFIQGITLKIKKSGTLTNTSFIRVSLYAGSISNPTGTAISNCDVFAGQVTTSFADFSLTLQNVGSVITPSTVYWAVITYSETGGGTFVLNSTTGTGTTFQGSAIGSISETNIQVSNIIYARNNYGAHFVGNHSHGIWATALTGVGVRGDSESHFGVIGFSTSGSGSAGASTWGNGIQGSSTNSYGGYFSSTSGNGLKGTTVDNTGFAGVFAENTSGNLAFFSNGKCRYIQSALSVSHQFQQFSQSNHTGGVATGLLWSAGAHTGQTSGTEMHDFNINLARTVTWLTTVPATQRFFRIQAPTMSCASVSTSTTASTFSVSGAPAAAGSAAITTPLSIWAESGDVQFDGTNTKIKHLVGTTSTPAIAAGTGAGTSPTISITGTDLAGYISITTGTLPTLSATVATITFNVAYGVAPRCVTLTPANTITAALSGLGMVYVDQASITTTTFPIVAGATALTATTAYKWFYQVVQ